MLKTKDLEYLQLTIPNIEEQKRVVNFLDLAQKERDFLSRLIKEKEQLSQAVLDTMIKNTISGDGTSVPYDVELKHHPLKKDKN